MKTYHKIGTLMVAWVAIGFFTRLIQMWTSGFDKYNQKMLTLFYGALYGPIEALSSPFVGIVLILIASYVLYGLWKK